MSYHFCVESSYAARQHHRYRFAAAAASAHYQPPALHAAAPFVFYRLFCTVDATPGLRGRWLMFGVTVRCGDIAVTPRSLRLSYCLPQGPRPPLPVRVRCQPRRRLFRSSPAILRFRKRGSPSRSRLFCCARRRITRRPTARDSPSPPTTVARFTNTLFMPDFSTVIKLQRCVPFPLCQYFDISCPYRHHAILFLSSYVSSIGHHHAHVLRGFSTLASLLQQGGGEAQFFHSVPRRHHRFWCRQRFRCRFSAVCCHRFRRISR